MSTSGYMNLNSYLISDVRADQGLPTYLSQTYNNYINLFLNPSATVNTLLNVKVLISYFIVM